MIDITTKRRLGRTLLAQLYSQIVTVACQLALVPLLLTVWGSERYGAWLVLTAVPTFLTFSDFGFTFVAKNEMAIAVASGYPPKALSTFQSIFMLLNIVAPLLYAMASLGIITLDLQQVLSVTIVGVWELRWALLLLVANVLLYQYFLLVCAGIRAENRPATEAIWAATSRLSESIVYGISAIFIKDFAIIAGLGLVSRVLFLTAAYISLRRLSPWLYFGYQAATLKEIGRLAHPAFAYMLVPIGQALVIQGPVVLLGKLAGPIAVVVFSTSRTLARVGTSVTNMFNNTFVAEYSATAGRGEVERFAHLRRIQLSICIVLIIGYVASMIIVGPLAMHLFTHGKVEIAYPLFYVILASVALEMLWSAQFTPISAINRHKYVTYALASTSIFGIVAMYMIVPSYGITGASAVICAIHLNMVLVCACVTHKISRQDKSYAASA
jgi:O-antigen/teichoic acid export membrane protein